MTAVALQIENLTVAFGAFTAVKNVSLSFHNGGRYAIIGPNGAGKTTLMNAITGGQRADAGTIRMNTVDITSMPIHLRARAGLGRSFQIVSIFPEQCVRDNIKIAAQAAVYGVKQPWWRPAPSYSEFDRIADEVLETISLAKYAAHIAGTLSYGEQRILDIGLALVANPALLLLDEPLAGLGHERIDQTIEMLRRIAAGRTVILVEHNMDAVMRFSEEIVVLNAGEVLAQGTPAEIRADSSVREAYLGPQ